jgi:hypothetical protein
MGAKLPLLSADDLAKVLDLEERVLDIEKWNASVKIRAFTIDERDKILAQCTEKDGAIPDGKQLIRLLVVHGVVEPRFTMEQVSKMAFIVVERIAKEVMELNGMVKKEGASAATVADVTFRQES